MYPSNKNLLKHNIALTSRSAGLNATKFNFGEKVLEKALVQFLGYKSSNSTYCERVIY